MVRRLLNTKGTHCRMKEVRNVSDARRVRPLPRKFSFPRIANWIQCVAVARTLVVVSCTLTLEVGGGKSAETVGSFHIPTNLWWRCLTKPWHLTKKENFSSLRQILGSMQTTMLWYRQPVFKITIVPKAKRWQRWLRRGEEWKSDCPGGPRAGSFAESSKLRQTWLNKWTKWWV